MSLFTDLLDDVYTATKRPDLVAETKLAVKAATLKMHQLDYYYRDLFETGIQFSVANYNQQLDIKSLLPRYRSLKYIRIFDSSGNPGNFLDIIPPELVIDSYGIDRTNVCYAAGNILQIKTEDTLQYCVIGVYLNPDVTEAGYTSWIAEMHPYAIVYDAAATVFKQIGFDEQSAQMKQLVAEQLAEIRLTNITAFGS